MGRGQSGARWQPDRAWRGRSQPSLGAAAFHTLPGCRPAPSAQRQRLRASVTAITSRSQTGCRQRWGKIFVSRLALSKGRKEVPGHAAGGERASAVLHEGQKSEGGWVLAWEEAARASCPVLPLPLSSAWAASSTAGHSERADQQPRDCREMQTS